MSRRSFLHTTAALGAPAAGIDSATVGHGWDFSEQSRVYGQRATVMRGVLDHGPYDVADGLATHDRPGRQRLGELVRAARLDEVDRACIGRFRSEERRVGPEW